jgi:hypothetical protein
VAVTTETVKADRLLRVEEVDAWGEYLESVRHQEDFRYQDIEPWAWARLQRRLRIVAARRKALGR